MSIKNVILELLENHSHNYDELATKTDQVDLKPTIAALIEEGLVVETEDNNFSLLSKTHYKTGSLRMHKKGFGFVHTDDKDFYISERDLNGAIHEDFVLIEKKKEQKGDKQEARILKRLKQNLKTVSGTYIKNSNGSIIKPDDSKLTFDVIVEPECPKAVDGHKVVATLNSYNDENKTGKATITNIIGHKNDPGVDILSIVAKHGIKIDFEDETVKQANAIEEDIPENEFSKRVDLRDKTIITIDGADSKDLDDAIHVESCDNGNIKLGVHIADVSYYVTGGSPLDLEAFQRGTSTYLVDRVIPMLPHRLSNGICSLNPSVDRLTLSCEMEINPKGEVVWHRLFESIIQTSERMTYKDVNAILLDNDPELKETYKVIYPMLMTMKDLFRILNEKRFNDGSIDFDVKEPSLHVDEEGKPLSITFRERKLAEKIIEEFMLIANQTVSKTFSELTLPSLYRIHENPDPEKLSQFADFIMTKGFRLNGNVRKPSPKHIQAVLDKFKGKPEESVLSPLLLRCMRQAKYSMENEGHFGLAFDHYTHFTSPIRRYPDLIIHRLIRTFIINKEFDPSHIDGVSSTLTEIAEQSSINERKSIEAEREVLELKKCEYIQHKLGEVVKGHLSSVTKFGFFVQLENTIEGLVHISTLDGHFVYDQKSLSLRHKSNGKKFSLGDEVMVRIVHVDLDEKQIDLEVVKHKRSKKPNIKPGRANHRSKKYRDLYQ